MKKFVFVAALVGTLFTGLSAVAQTTQASELMTCTVQVEGQEPQVSLSVILQEDTSADFVMIQLTDIQEGTLFFTQLEKGAVERSMTEGSFTGLMLQENFASDVGVIRNSGIFTVSFENGATTGNGLFAAKGHIYPLSCTLK